MQHPELTPLDVAQKLLFEAALQYRKPNQLILDVNASLGRVVAEDIYAEHDLPPADVSAVDGYAFHSEMLASNPDFSFQIIGEAKAGHPFTGEILPNQALRIYTGAVMPNGPDIVVMHEDCTYDAQVVKSDLVLKKGSNIRPKGENLAQSELLISAGQRITPSAIGQLNAAGISSISAFESLRVGVLSMGDEVVPAGQALRAGQIYDSNKPMLTALLAAERLDVEDGGIIADNKEGLVQAYRNLLSSCDVVISSAGASDGIEDHTQAALREIGAEILFWRVAIKPGRPVSVARLGKKFIFCLPGNPVAVYVCFLLLVKPVLDILAGGSPVPQITQYFPCDFGYKKKKGRTEFVRVTLQTEQDGTQKAVLHGRKGAGVISSLLGADGLIEIPSEADTIEPDTRLRFIPFPNEV